MAAGVVSASQIKKRRSETTCDVRRRLAGVASAPERTSRPAVVVGAEAVARQAGRPLARLMAGNGSVSRAALHEAQLVLPQLVRHAQPVVRRSRRRLRRLGWWRRLRLGRRRRGCWLGRLGWRWRRLGLDGRRWRAGRPPQIGELELHDLLPQLSTPLRRSAVGGRAPRRHWAEIADAARHPASSIPQAARSVSRSQRPVPRPRPKAEHLDSEPRSRCHEHRLAGRRHIGHARKSWTARWLPAPGLVGQPPGELGAAAVPWRRAMCAWQSGWSGEAGHRT